MTPLQTVLEQLFHPFSSSLGYDELAECAIVPLPAPAPASQQCRGLRREIEDFFQGGKKSVLTSDRLVSSRKSIFPFGRDAWGGDVWGQGAWGMDDQGWGCLGLGCSERGCLGSGMLSRGMFEAGMLGEGSGLECLEGGCSEGECSGEDVWGQDTRSRDIWSRDTRSRDVRSRDAQHCGQASDASADAPSGCSHWSTFWEAGCRGQATACVPTTLRLPSAARSRAGSCQLARAGGKAWHGTEPHQAAGSGRTGREPSS